MDWRPAEAMDGGVSGLHRDNFEVHEVSKEEFFESKKKVAGTPSPLPPYV
jgi:hypothetical protein